MLAYVSALADGPPAVALYAPALAVSLVVAVVLASVRVTGAASAAIVAALLLSNWALNVLHSHTGGDPLDPMAMAAIDWTTAVAIFPMMTRSRCAAMIVALYALQMVTHAARLLVGWIGVSSPYVADTAYFWALSYSAWAQVFFLVMWIVNGGRRHRRRANRGALPVAPRVGELAGRCAGRVGVDR